MNMLGQFSQNGRPIFEIDVFGVSEKVKTKFTATIDTGYTGFLAMPFTVASRLGLILV
jgi:predicted aspartyl protease